MLKQSTWNLKNAGATNKVKDISNMKQNHNLRELG